MNKVCVALCSLACSVFAADESRVLTVENKVSVMSVSTTVWQPATLGQVLHIGDKLRTEKNSRATVRLADHSVLRIKELTTFEFPPPQQKDRKPLLDLKSGSLYFFSREKPLDCEFRTPTAAGAIRGTEFLLTAGDDGETRLALLDGAVDLSNDAGQVQIHSGEEARAGR